MGHQYYASNTDKSHSVTEFTFMGFSTDKNICILHLVLFFFIYFCALMGNILIIVITTLDQNLHTLMYYFLNNLSFGDLCLISVTIPKSIANSLSHSNSISFTGCVAQFFLVVFSATTELHLLTAVCFDHYAAICHPLHYEIIMNKDMRVQLTAVSWLGGGLIALMHTVGTFSLSYCGSNIVHQFFCDIPLLLAISCSENLMREIVPILISVVLDTCCFIYILISYVNIFATVKKIQSTEGQSKAYCTCLPHLVVVVLFLFSGIFTYLKPTSGIPSISDLLISIFYTMVPPTFNPIIYSLKNNVMKTSLWSLLKKIFTKK
ncbi:olfactory receptor 14A16 [Ailuropoda melanoleuca]|uniref:olfactory receptor 14A16 n=1 Tax=Ailuropoda melanoleuca TaxID=9646 RepID=UPI001493FFBB|nr:olfactory receptor 14A16 [Ailuropoda melanoleuca]